MSVTAAREDERLEALRRYRILDTEDEEAFKQITADMAAEFDVPVAAICFLDRDRQWFKASQGLRMRETSRAVSFCAHALDRPDPEPMVVRDAFLDLRFARNPLVRGAPGIRFYAGAPILDPAGHVLGSACIVDLHPRPEGLSAAETARLAEFAERAMAHTDLHRLRLEWLDRLPEVLLERAANARRAGATAEAERLVKLAYAAAERRSD